MRKFLIVGCGGSGGATLRFLMDQLRADLRAHDIRELPDAWQFIHVDVPVAPEAPEGFGSVRDLGGRYVSVSSPGNAYTLVANSVEQSLATHGALRGLLGWTPAPKESASHVPVVNGAGQYRAVGRMLTLTDLGDIRAEFERAWSRMQQAGAWGELPTKMGPFDPDRTPVPIVVGSMAGGSGASMFLDICRLLGRLPGLKRDDLAAFLFSPDVFHDLPESARTGIDGNALGALGEIIAAQSRASDQIDNELLEALGVLPDTVDEPAFARVFPIGSSIGGDGARFGDGTAAGVYRGLGRAFAATMTSSAATEGFIKKIENPAGLPTNRQLQGWGTEPSNLAWGSFGFASLSLGRDRYATYASQRVARAAVDRLVSGHVDPLSPMPDTEQLTVLVDSQWSTFLERLRFPLGAQSAKDWFVTTAFAAEVRDIEARRVSQEAVTAMNSEAPGQAAAWVQLIQMRLQHFQPEAAEKVRSAAYLWASGWALHLEESTLAEFERAMTQRGIPYARRLAQRLAEHLHPVIDELRRAAEGGAGQPLEVDQRAATQAGGMRKTVIGAGHAIADVITRGFTVSAQKSLNREAARLASEVLSSFVADLLPMVDRAAAHALENLQHAAARVDRESGLAQLETDIYGEWPDESSKVPSRFDHADNEVLLTTSKDFPEQFSKDVLSSVTAVADYSSALGVLVDQVISGKWETTDATGGNHEIVVRLQGWRAPILTKDATTGEPTPKSRPSYELVVKPKDVLARSKALLSATGQPFQKYSDQSISDFLNDLGESERERSQRAEQFVAKFEETMQLARPLVGVNPKMISVMHPSEQLTYEYSFSDIPLKEDPMATRLQRRLEDKVSGGLSHSTVLAFESALGDPGADDRGTNRIAVFGSYPKYSPLVFSSLLDQIKKRWASAPEQALDGLWQWKRTRPLPAGLGMNVTEMRAMIGGWFLGRLLGVVVQPNRTERNPVQVWDFDEAEPQWRAFPARLLTPPQRLRSGDDWLPAVLESHSLAVVLCNEDVTLQALRPYAALRRIYDSGLEEPNTAVWGTTAEERLSAWVETGAWPAGRPSLVVDPKVVEPGATREDRLDAAANYLRLCVEHVENTYLTDGSGFGVNAARRTKVNTLADLYKAPKFAEIAELTHSVLTDLVATLDKVRASGAGQYDQTTEGSDAFNSPF